MTMFVKRNAASLLVNYLPYAKLSIYIYKDSLSTDRSLQYTCKGTACLCSIYVVSDRTYQNCYTFFNLEKHR